MEIIKKHVTWGNKGSILEPEGILIHGIFNKRDKEKRFDATSIVDILKEYGVAAHYLVLRTGGVWELVPSSIQCWHAGKSEFRGVKGLNSSFIGIEFIGDEETDYTDLQYFSGGQLISDLSVEYSIPTHMITTHQIVSGPDVRPDWKWDPGPRFDMIRMSMEIAEAA